MPNPVNTAIDRMNSLSLVPNRLNSAGADRPTASAMAVGLPIVTTAVGGSPEIVIPDETGKLVPPQQPEKLAAAMIEMIEERPLWPDIGRTARERIEQNFNIRTMIQKYETLYSELHSQVFQTN